MAQPDSSGADRGYFVGRWVDGAAVGGLSIVVVLALPWVLGPSTGEPGTLHMFAIGSLVNFPHFSATNFRLYRSQHNRAQFPVTAYVLPAVVMAGIALTLSYPALGAPYLVALYAIWSPYHYAGQTIGLTMLYARRHDVAISPGLRRWLFVFCYATFISALLPAVGGGDSAEFFAIRHAGYSLPTWTRDVALIVVVVSALVSTVTLFLWARREGRTVPTGVLVPLASHAVWFLFTDVSPWVVFAIPVAHSIQYLFVAWMMQLKENLDDTKSAPSARNAVRESVRWYLANVTGGIMLYVVLPLVLAVIYDGVLEWYVVYGIVAAWLNIHHFFVDGVIWKLRRRDVASPLMVRLRDLVSA